MKEKGRAGKPALFASTSAASTPVVSYRGEILINIWAGRSRGSSPHLLRFPLERLAVVAMLANQLSCLFRRDAVGLGKVLDLVVLLASNLAAVAASLLVWIVCHR